MVGILFGLMVPLLLIFQLLILDRNVFRPLSAGYTASFRHAQPVFASSKNTTDAHDSVNFKESGLNPHSGRKLQGLESPRPECLTSASGSVVFVVGAVAHVLVMWKIMDLLGVWLSFGTTSV